MSVLRIIPTAEYSEGVTPEGAVAYWQAKKVVTPKEYAALEGMYKDAAFTISHVEEELLLETARAGMEAAIEQGLTGAEFEKMMNEAFDAAGVGRLGKHHLDTVFRTNVMSAYSAGRYEQQMDPEVRDELPWFEFRKATGTPCDICDPMNGFKAPKDDPIWSTHYPPLHHNCACGVYSIEAPDQAKVSPPKVQPAEGFDVRPGEWHREASE